MDNALIPQAIDIVSKAIKADNEKEYEAALSLYRDALARFTVSEVLYHSCWSVCDLLKQMSWKFIWWV